MCCKGYFNPYQIQMKLINFKFFLLKVSEFAFTIFNTSPPISIS